MTNRERFLLAMHDADVMIVHGVPETEECKKAVDGVIIAITKLKRLMNFTGLMEIMEAE